MTKIFKHGLARERLARVVLVGALILFVIAFAIGSGVVGGNTKPWAEGGFVLLVTALLLD